ncbi:hypothetical protein LPJ61_005255, partial [Coemansia biformis]
MSESGVEWNVYELDINSYSLDSEDSLSFSELIFSIMVSTSNIKVTNGDGKM